MNEGRRHFVTGLGAAWVELGVPSSGETQPIAQSDTLQLFLCGDVMTGRGIDQVLPHPGDPKLYEPWVEVPHSYVELAERAHGPIPKPIAPSYVWGEALGIMAAADLRIINLETAVTKLGEPAVTKRIHYRMHPDNVGCLTSAGVDCCVLANNHVLDWGPDGLVETLEVLRRTGLKVAGAGRDASEAAEAAVCESNRGRALVFGLGSTDSGIPRSWAASDREPGVSLLEGCDRDVARVRKKVERAQKPNDVVVASVHWGGNWGYRIPAEHRRLAHRLIDEAGVDIVHGHSSHHVKGIEVYRQKLILYGCGDFINDYEGIGGHDEYRPNLTLAYLASVDPTNGMLRRLVMVPLERHRFRLRDASDSASRLLSGLLTREGRQLGTVAEPDAEGSIALRW